MTTDAAEVLLLFSANDAGIEPIEPLTPEHLEAIKEVERRIPRLVKRHRVFDVRYLTPLGRAVRAALAAGSRAGNPDDGDEA